MSEPRRPAAADHGATQTELPGRGAADTPDPSGRGRPGNDALESRVDDASTTRGEAAAGGPMRQQSLFGDAWRSLRRNPAFLLGSALLGVLTLMAVFPRLFTSKDPRSCDLSRSRQGPSGEAWFGYDVQGCDYYANVIHGARVSMVIGLVVVLGALVLAVLLGSLAGYFGGWIDSLIARLTDVWFGIPFILGAILVLQAFPSRGLFEVSVALIVLSWMTPLRLIRSTVISVKEADYVQAARALGANTSRIIVRHILPNAVAPVLVYGTILIGVVIAAEATLSFLGVGLQLPAISWGLQISGGQRWLRDASHLVLFPSIFLSVTVLSFILLGDALRDALDPKLR